MNIKYCNAIYSCLIQTLQSDASDEYNLTLLIMRKTNFLIHFFLLDFFNCVNHLTMKYDAYINLYTIKTNDY